MNLIFLAMTALALLTGLAALGLLLRPLTPHPALARSAGVIALCLLLFCLEHFVGLGRLDGTGVTMTGAAAVLCWRQRHRLWENRRAEGVFLLAFAYAFAWRFCYPDIDPSSEHLTDLYFIGNYLPGERLPPPDRWLPPYRFDFYYAFQHYAAALLGRLFGLDPGTTYNFAFCTLVALIVSTAWLVIAQFCPWRHGRWLVLFAFVLGGSGVSPLAPWLFNETPADVAMWQSMRFIGSMDASIDTVFGQAIFAASGPSTASGEAVRLDLPLETFSYLVFLGDFHPPLGGLLLLLVALACIGILERQADDRFAQAVLVGCVPLALITNAWVFPLQAALAAAWVAHRYVQRHPPDGKTLAFAALLTCLLVYPALRGLAAHALAPPLRWVDAVDHTPWRHFLAVHWPLLTLLLLVAWRRTPAPLAVTLLLLWGVLLLLSEFVYIDDIYGGQFNRFNTVLKWWTWLHAGILLTLGAIALGSDRRAIRLGAAAVLLLLSLYGINIARFWLEQPQPARGRMHGHAWLSSEPASRDLLAYLSAAPPGIVLERNDKGAYGRVSAYALFAGQPALLGWADHEWLWRGAAAHVRTRGEQIALFYSGNLGDSLAWLLQHDVRYIVWSAGDDALAPSAFDRLGAQLASRYAWQPFNAPGEPRSGLWIRHAAN